MNSVKAVYRDEHVSIIEQVIRVIDSYPFDERDECIDAIANEVGKLADAKSETAVSGFLDEEINFKVNQRKNIAKFNIHKKEVMSYE